MKQLFSVIIPALNEERFLPRLLAHLSHQELKNFDVIVVEGKSDDDTRKAALRFKSLLPITVHTVTTRNVSFQRNYGASRARGTYLLFMDADSIIRKDFTKRLANTVRQTNADVYIPWLMADTQSRRARGLFIMINVVVSVFVLTSKPFSNGGSMIIKNSLFKKLGGFDSSMPVCEDHDLVRRAKQAGGKIRMLRKSRIGFSLRRLEREGYVSLGYKFIVSSVAHIFTGSVHRRMYEYQMGGHLYAKGAVDTGRKVTARTS